MEYVKTWFQSAELYWLIHAAKATASIATYRIDPRVVSGFGGTGAADGATA